LIAGPGSGAEEEGKPVTYRCQVKIILYRRWFEPPVAL